jgi:flagellar hook-basal body complex protein FliE
MAIEPLNMDALLAKLNAAREAVAHAPVAPGALREKAGAGAPAAKAVDFGALLKASVAGVDADQAQANALAERFQLGDPKVGLEQTMVALAKANVSFQEMVQVRNRMIAAYHEVMNMQV